MERYPAPLARHITDLIPEKLLVEVGSSEDDLVASGVLDSLTLVQLLVDLEHRFGVTIPLEELEIDDFRSITSIAHLVHRRTQISAAEPVTYATATLEESAGHP